MYNFNYDGSKFRLHIENEDYHVNKGKGTVTVVANVYVSTPFYVFGTIDSSQMPEGVSTRWGGNYVRMSAVARCSEEDSFDEEKGKKIAMAKLEAKAYRRFRKTLWMWYTRFNTFVESLGEMVNDFHARSVKAQEHDEKYVQDISDRY